MAPERTPRNRPTLRVQALLKRKAEKTASLSTREPLYSLILLPHLTFAVSNSRQLIKKTQHMSKAQPRNKKVIIPSHPPTIVAHDNSHTVDQHAVGPSRCLLTVGNLMLMSQLPFAGIVEDAIWSVRVME